MTKGSFMPFLAARFTLAVRHWSKHYTRECLKELGTVVKIQGLTCVREYIADNHEFFAPWTAGVHHIDFIFTCGVDDAFDLSVVKRPLPPFLTDVKWLDSKDLMSVRFYPKRLAELLNSGVPSQGLHYLGDSF